MNYDKEILNCDLVKYDCIVVGTGITPCTYLAEKGMMI